jgi:indoleamine 2,3-dioxygenase
MTLQAPDVDTYCISPHLGFLSDNPPLRSFTKSQYAPWDELIANLPRLISSHSLRRTVDDTLPYIDPSDLSTELENQRAYVVLGFLIHAYVWCETGDDVATGLERQPRGTIPPQLAEPFLHVCDELGLPPVLLYAGLCLWNWKLGAVQDVLPAAANQFYELEQLECVGSFTGDLGETDFNLVPVLVEAEGGPLVRLLLDAVVAGAAGGDEAAKSVQRALEICAETIGRMRKHLAKLYSTLDADFFYHRLRPFLSGGNGMEDRGLPRGFVFQRRDGSEKAVKCIGGSAAQSSLFQFLDLVLGVEHASTGDGDPETLFQVRFFPLSRLSSRKSLWLTRGCFVDDEGVYAAEAPGFSRSRGEATYNPLLRATARRGRVALSRV